MFPSRNIRSPPHPSPARRPRGAVAAVAALSPLEVARRAFYSDVESVDMAEKKGAKPAPKKQRTASERTEVDELLAEKRHPLHDDIQSIRATILAADPSIREEVKWSSVSFRNDRDFFATVNLRSTDSLQLVLYTGVKAKATAKTGVSVEDPRGLIEKWAAKDRCLVTLGKGPEVEANKAAFVALVRGWLEFVR